MYKLYPVDPLTNEPRNMVIRLADHTHIPMNPDNTDYQAYLRWLEEGNTPLPAEENQ